MLKQSNEYDAQRNHLRKAVESLRREKGLFQNILQKLRSQIEEESKRAKGLEEEEKLGLNRL